MCSNPQFKSRQPDFFDIRPPLTDPTGGYAGGKRRQRVQADGEGTGTQHRPAPPPTPAESPGQSAWRLGLNIRPEGRWTWCRWGRSSTGSIRGSIPFRKATECQIHVSGGEFNVAANLADCFGLKTGIATAMVDYPIGDLIAERVRAMGVKPFYKRFEHDGVTGPNMATVYSDRGHGVRGAGGLLQPLQRGGGAAQAGRFRLEADLRRRRPLVPQRRHLRGALRRRRRS